MPTGIEWTEETLNPIRGCSHISPGCDHCYAERMAARFSRPGMPYEGLVKNGRWTGSVLLDCDALEKPLHWKKPRMIFVNSMSDLFHNDLPSCDIESVFTIISRCPQHTFQILTKRAQRMETYFRVYSNEELKALSNVWLGVSVENQRTAEERIPILLQTPAAVRFISCEPLLEDARIGDVLAKCNRDGLPYVDWIIVGAESGPGARPMDLDWAREIVRFGILCNVPVFVKQLCHNGRKIPFERWPTDLQVRQMPEGNQWAEHP